MIRPSNTSPEAKTSPADSTPSDTVAVDWAWRPIVIFAAASPALTSMLVIAMRRPASSAVTVTLRSPAPLLDVDQLVAALDQAADLRPIQFGVGAQRNPAVLADVGCSIEAIVLEKDGLHFFTDFDADREHSLVSFQHRKSFGAHLKGGVAEGSGFTGFRQS